MSPFHELLDSFEAKVGHGDNPTHLFCSNPLVHLQGICKGSTSALQGYRKSSGPTKPTSIRSEFETHPDCTFSDFDGERLACFRNMLKNDLASGGGARSAPEAG